MLFPCRTAPCRKTAWQIRPPWWHCPSDGSSDLHYNKLGSVWTFENYPSTPNLSLPCLGFKFIDHLVKETLLSSVVLQNHRPAGSICVWAQRKVHKLLGDLVLPIFHISSVCVKTAGLCPLSMLVLIPWMTVGGWWVQLGWAAFLCRHLWAQPLFAEHFWHKNSWEVASLLSQERGGTTVCGFSEIFQCCK